MPDTPQSENPSSQTSPGSRDVSDAIAAEIQDHLASAAEKIARQGTDDEQARQLAAKNFGNPEQIQRRCWWIQQGDQVMFRGIAVTLLVVLCLGLVAMGFGNWRLNARLEELTAVITELSKRQSQAPAREPKQPPEISGHCYLRDRAHSAAGAEIELRQLPGLEVVRRLRTDHDGRFRSGPLIPGDYCILAPLAGSNNPTVYVSEHLFTAEVPSSPDVPKPLYWIQTEPLYVRQDASLSPVELDLHFAAGYVVLDPKSEFPDQVEVGDKQFSLSAYVHVADDLIGLPWRPSERLPPKWPAIGKIDREITLDCNIPHRPDHSPVALGVNFGSAPPEFRAIPAGRYRLTAQLITSQKTPPVFGSAGAQGFFGPNKPSAPPPATEISVADEQTTEVEVRFPDDIVERVRRAIEAKGYGAVNGEVRVVSTRKEESQPEGKLPDRSSAPSGDSESAE